jgi:hypothetical protein
MHLLPFPSGENKVQGASISRKMDLLAYPTAGKTQKMDLLAFPSAGKTWKMHLLAYTGAWKSRKIDLPGRKMHLPRRNGGGDGRGSAAEGRVLSVRRPTTTKEGGRTGAGAAHAGAAADRTAQSRGRGAKRCREGGVRRGTDGGDEVSAACRPGWGPAFPGGMRAYGRAGARRAHGIGMGPTGVGDCSQQPVPVPMEAGGGGIHRGPARAE